VIFDLICVSTGKPGEYLPVKRNPEKLIQLKRKVCDLSSIIWDFKLF